MALNTRERSNELQAAARALIQARGVDITRQVAIRPLAQILATEAGCHYDTAKRHIAKAVRLARGEHSAAWGGARPGSGRPKTMNH